MVIRNKRQTPRVAAPELAKSAARTPIRPENSDEWEAVIVRRRLRLYKIKISRRARIRGIPHTSDEIYVQSGPTRYALTLNGARWKARRMVKQLNRADGLTVSIARIIEVRPRAWS